MYTPGQKIVSLRNFPKDLYPTPSLHETVTVAECFIDRENTWVVILKEYSAPIDGGPPAVFSAKKFAPLDDILNEELAELIESCELVEI